MTDDSGPAFFFLHSFVLVLLIQEAGSGNTSHKSDEEDFVKVDDLPLQLTVMTEVRRKRSPLC